jgi:hypothetical protein
MNLSVIDKTLLVFDYCNFKILNSKDSIDLLESLLKEPLTDAPRRMFSRISDRTCLTIDLGYFRLLKHCVYSFHAPLRRLLFFRAVLDFSGGWLSQKEKEAYEILLNDGVQLSYKKHDMIPQDKRLLQALTSIETLSLTGYTERGSSYQLYDTLPSGEDFLALRKLLPITRNVLIGADLDSKLFDFLKDHRAKSHSKQKRPLIVLKEFDLTTLAKLGRQPKKFLEIVDKIGTLQFLPELWRNELKIDNNSVDLLETSVFPILETLSVGDASQDTPRHQEILQWCISKGKGTSIKDISINSLNLFDLDKLTNLERVTIHGISQDFKSIPPTIKRLDINERGFFRLSEIKHLLEKLDLLVIGFQCSDIEIDMHFDRPDMICETWSNVTVNESVSRLSIPKWYTQKAPIIKSKQISIEYFNNVGFDNQPTLVSIGTSCEEIHKTIILPISVKWFFLDCRRGPKQKKLVLSFKYQAGDELELLEKAYKLLKKGLRTVQLLSNRDLQVFKPLENLGLKSAKIGQDKNFVSIYRDA